jgi:RHS repeat-associated protein
LLYRETPQGGINYVFLGNKLIAKEGTGVVAVEDSIMNYKPFGESIEEPKDDVGFTGHKFDTDLGLSYMQARYYDPVIGRFYSNDPSSFSNVHNFNRYAYANNNPYKFIDPDGRDSFLVGRGLNAAKGLAGYVAGHLYVVSGAKFAGDTGPNVRYHSFGENGQGLTGLLSEGNEGILSKGTTLADVKHWGSLSKGSGSAVNFSKNDALTQKLANSAIAEVKYEWPSVEVETSTFSIGKYSVNVPTGTKLSSVINSSSMAAGVANKVTGGTVSLPDATGVLGYPGAENSNKVNFREDK